MSDRIAHRPRNRRINSYVQSSKLTEKEYRRNRWSFRRRTAYYEKRPLGYSLSLVPLGYKLVRGLLVRYA